MPDPQLPKQSPSMPRDDLRPAEDALIAVLADIVESSCTRPRIVQSAPKPAAKQQKGAE